MVREPSELVADKTVVFDLMDHLRRSFEDFCNTYHKDVPYVDAFMGIHNFYRLILRDIASRAKMPAKTRAVFYKMAADTFYKSLLEESARQCNAD